MHLKLEQSDFFFKVYYPLLYFSYSAIENLDVEEFIKSGISNHIKAREIIYKNREIVDEYIEEIKKNIQPEPTRLTLLNSIKTARYSDFFVVERDGQIYFRDCKKQNAIYLVSGISQDLIEIFHHTPCITRTAIFLYEGVIISDGLNLITKQKFPKKISDSILNDFERDLATDLKHII